MMPRSFDRGRICPMIGAYGASFTAPAERSDAMFLAMIQGHLQHCADLDAADLPV